MKSLDIVFLGKSFPENSPLEGERDFTLSGRLRKPKNSDKWKGYICGTFGMLSLNDIEFSKKDGKEILSFSRQLLGGSHQVRYSFERAHHSHTRSFWLGGSASDCSIRERVELEFYFPSDHFSVALGYRPYIASPQFFAPM
ncbi:MAG: hypothetical protein WC444_03265 [Candidatus Paceibacterota bacterium]